MRESLFNVLAGGHGERLDGALVLDLFAGTGAMGLEALSRGARRVTFVENGRAALGILRRNIGICRVGARARVLARDARRPGRCDEGHDLVFLDPPYDEGLGERALAAALAGGWVAPRALVIWEERAAVAAPEGLRLLDERRHGGTAIRIFARG